MPGAKSTNRNLRKRRKTWSEETRINIKRGDKDHDW
jgi:hypothetical protein